MGSKLKAREIAVLSAFIGLLLVFLLITYLSDCKIDDEIVKHLNL